LTKGKTITPLGCLFERDLFVVGVRNGFWSIGEEDSEDKLSGVGTRTKGGGFAGFAGVKTSQ